MTRTGEQQVLVLCSYNSFTDQRHNVNVKTKTDSFPVFMSSLFDSRFFATAEVPNLSDKVTLRVILVIKE